jgi:hypothetical protein
MKGSIEYQTLGAQVGGQDEGKHRVPDARCSGR